ncbi:hypothetical protein EU524_00790 [Candidatus Thorarchaeota archaeon]|nr:MAG: hypothetical protein EU524_00790 [Candidatus Thorarchaeota archaeon]
MDIPILTNFIEGLRVFFDSKRLRWLTLVFVVGALLITILERVVFQFTLLAGLAALAGGIFPVYFMLTAIVSLVGLSRFVADDESYFNSAVMTVVWMVVSGIVLMAFLIFLRQLFNLVFIGIAFLGWIGFQSYFATRTSLGYAESVVIADRSWLVRGLYAFIYFFNYALIVGAFVVSVILNPGVFLSAAFFLALFGGLLALGFNFLNGMILIAERNKSTASSLSFLGLFISAYSAYFIYNVLKPFDGSLDPISLAISLFFVVYTMSGIGSTLSSRADLDTRWKLSRELAATTTYFLASGFLFVDAMFTVLVADPSLAGAVGDAVKLIVFPFVALVMELVFIRRSRKVLEVAPVPVEMPVAGEEAEQLEEEQVEPETGEEETGEEADADDETEAGEAVETGVDDTEETDSSEPF